MIAIRKLVSIIFKCAAFAGMIPAFSGFTTMTRNPAQAEIVTAPAMSNRHSEQGVHKTAEVSAENQRAKTVEMRILELEQIWMRAAQQRNVQVLDRILSNDYVDINYRGILRHKADALRTSNLQLNIYTQKLSREHVRLYANTAVVTGCDILMTGKHRYFARFTDVFAEQHGAWRAVSSQETAAPHCSEDSGNTMQH